jgi:DNA-binding LytR/AlgR family response regulator
MSGTITLRWRNRRTAVRIDDILYIESYNRHLSVFTLNGKTEVVGKLSEMAEHLPETDFLCIHKSFVVNMKYITEIDGRGAVLTDGSVLPVSVRRKTAAIKKFDSYCDMRGVGKCLFWE